ncbi:MAG: hypothetical protein M0033_08785 [Nitrospiraceae bacterium]|nr:hypothetical protein [Nitrospiraceae bacterium]MDA8326304.1 hypothetical protein [Nitrospiraceae bacterium]
MAMSLCQKLPLLEKTGIAPPLFLKYYHYAFIYSIPHLGYGIKSTHLKLQFQMRVIEYR